MNRLASAVLLLLASGVPAQEPPHRSPDATYVLEDEESMLRAFRDAEEHHAAGRLREAAARLLEVASRSGDAVQPAGRTLYLPAAEVARRRLLELPPEEVAAAAETARREAVAALADAREARDPVALARVAREFTPLPQGAQAAEALGDLEAERGDAGQAARLYARALELLPPGSSRAALLARRAFALSELGDGAAIRAMGAGLSPAEAGATVRAGASDRALGALLEELGRRAQPPEAGDWFTHGGDYSRARDTPLPDGPLAHVWSSPFVSGGTAPKEPAPLDERVLAPEEHTTGLPIQPDPLAPLFPAVSRGRVYVADLRALTVLDATTGKALHRVPFDAQPEPWNESRPACPPRFVTVAEELIACTERGRLLVFQAGDGAPRLLWSRGGTNDQDPRTAGLVFSGAPVILSHTVFAAATLRRNDFRVTLHAFDARTGNPGWARFICSGNLVLQDVPANPNDVFELNNWDPGELQIAEHQGVLYLGTNLGIVAAVDRALGEIVWLHRYRRLPNPSDLHARLPSRIQRWPDHPVMIAGDRLFLTPRDSNHLHILHLAPDKETGALEADLIDKKPHDEEITCLVAARPDRMLLSTRDLRGEETAERLRARSLGGTERSEFWTFELPDDGGRDAFLGRAALGGARVYVPTRKYLYVLAAEDGRVLSATPPRRPSGPEGTPEEPGFGNVIPVPGGVLTASYGQVSFWRGAARR